MNFFFSFFFLVTQFFGEKGDLGVYSLPHEPEKVKCDADE